MVYVPLLLSVTDALSGFCLSETLKVSVVVFVLFSGFMSPSYSTSAFSSTELFSMVMAAG